MLQVELWALLRRVSRIGGVVIHVERKQSLARRRADPGITGWLSAHLRLCSASTPYFCLRTLKSCSEPQIRGDGNGIKPGLDH